MLRRRVYMHLGSTILVVFLNGANSELLTVWMSALTKLGDNGRSRERVIEGGSISNGAASLRRVQSGPGGRHLRASVGLLGVGIILTKLGDKRRARER
jgi:hypothetical protein